MIDQPLMDYFKFDQADLNANENGQFTEKQKDGSSKRISRTEGGAESEGSPCSSLAP
jgi:hypothetical protein